MSALDGWIDICRAGDWRDMAGRDVRLDEDRLDRILPSASGATLPRGALTDPRAFGATPSIDITFENRGTPQREVSREVRLDPRGLIVTVVTEDLDGGGPASQAIARRFGLRDAVA